MSTTPDLNQIVALLERGREAGWHLGAQCYVSWHGEVLLDVAVGESERGRELRTDDLMLWYSAGKPLTVAAILQLWDEDELSLDDPISMYVDGWAAGKERATIRHVLTHTGGFPMYGKRDLYGHDLSYAEAVAQIAEHPAEWEPGRAAGYHPTSGWKILGAIVEAIDGRSIDQYLAEEVLAPARCEQASLGISLDQQAELGSSVVPVHWNGYAVPVPQADGGMRMVPYHAEEVNNQDWNIAKVEPGAGMRGPASALGRFYESLLGHGDAILDSRTIEVMTAVHRHGLKDGLFGRDVPWGLGVQVEFSGGTSRRAFGHSGMATSRALADPECGLVVVLITNTLAGFFENEQRHFEVTNAAYSSLGKAVSAIRQEATPVAPAGLLSSQR